MPGLPHPSWASIDSGHRLIDIAWPGTAAAPALWPRQLRYRDELNQPFQLDATCLCGVEGLDTRQLHGRPVAFGVDTGNGQRRWLSGIVTAATKREGSGSFALVDLRVESALSLLDRRRTCRVFQDQSVPQIVAAVLDEHRQRNPSITACFRYDCTLQHEHPARSYCVQFNESDQAFIDRLLAEEGITYYFTTDPQSDTHGHRLLLTDSAPSQEQPARPLYYRAQADAVALQEQRLSSWQARSQLIGNRVSLSSHDYRSAQRLHGQDENAQQRNSIELEAASSLTDYQAVAPYYADDNRELDRYARRRMQAEELRANTFHGQGRLRELATGHRFVLHDHPAHAGDAEAQRTFIVTGTDLQLRNNLPEGWQLPDNARDIDEASENILLHFSAVQQDVPLVPRYAGHLDRPTANGPQTATVVGPAGEEVYTDELGRIRIQFHWQRPEEHPHGAAEGNDRASTWVRVAMPSSGDGFGHQFVPRIGQEVLVSFIQNDIDRPVVTGVLYGGRHATPRFSGRSGLPGNRALSGIQSREHHGEGHSELLMDDTPGQVRARLASTPAASELNLGRLSTPRVDGQAQPRGDGAELRTDAALALRAAHGMLITTYARELAQGGQLDRQELLTLLDECVELFRGLGQTASERGTTHSDPTGLEKLQQDLRNWPAADAAANGAPVLALAASAGLVSATPASQLHYAGGNHDVVASDDVQTVSGGHTRLQAGHGVSLYAQDQDIQLIANQGNLLLQAQAADILAQAQQNLHLSASEGDVIISAPRIRLVADDGSYLCIGGGIEMGTDGAAVVHAATHEWREPKTDSTSAPTFGRAPASQQHRFHYEGDVAAAVADIRHAVTLDDGDTVEGQSTSDGLGEHIERDGMQRASLNAMQIIEDAAGGSDGA